ncbi:replicative DNA helicase, partial [Ideonella sp.]|uniref:replicative DNA helicase n=1 Tax=Ideonella sp. TaxID=1929293 RepID=UPI003BB66DE0
MSSTDALLRSPASEQAVLGALLFDAPAALARVADVGLRADDFGDARHRDVWTAVGSLAERRQVVDVVAVFEQLRMVGNAADDDLVFLGELAAAVPSMAAVGQHANTVKDKATRRRIAAAAADAAELARTGSGSAAELADQAGALFVGIGSGTSFGGPRGLPELLADRIGYWQDLNAGRLPAGISTGLPRLDRALGGGFKPGKLVVIGARPSVGKTSLAGQVTLAVAGAGHRALVFSQEMTAGELLDRFASNLGAIGLDALSAGTLSEQDFIRLADASDRIANLALHIDDSPAQRLADVRNKCRRVAQASGPLSLVVIDYLQLMQGSRPNDNRNA